MPITVMISLVVTVALFLISLLFRIAARLNLTLPLLYFLAVSTILNPWAASHEKLAFAILYLLTARQRGIPLDSVHFDSQGHMRYNNSNNIVE